MTESGKSLDKAAADHKIPAERDEQFQNSEKELDSAYAKLDRMKRLNEELAQKALAQENLAKLADKEKKLADKAADLAEKDPVKDPSAKDQAEQLKQQQEQTAADLQKLTDENPALKKALDEARAEEARDLADRAKSWPSSSATWPRPRPTPRRSKTRSGWPTWPASSRNWPTGRMSWPRRRRSRPRRRRPAR